MSDESFRLIAHFLYYFGNAHKKLCVIVLFLVCTRFLCWKMLSYQGFQCVKTWHASCLYKGVKQNKENLGDEGKWQKQLC